MSQRTLKGIGLTIIFLMVLVVPNLGYSMSIKYMLYALLGIAEAVCIYLAIRIQRNQEKHSQHD